MELKVFLKFLFFLLVVFLLIFYWFFPFDSKEFFVSDEFKGTSNFSLNSGDLTQFYSNLRFQNSQISYKIEDCTLQKKDDMERAFEIVAEKTVLSFYPVASNEEIYVTCSSRNQVEGGLFVAGEGGPTNITKAGDFNVIYHGDITLLRDSKCSVPNVGIHELFHVLGFNHSENSNNIMYPVSKCDQEISQDMIDLINELYSISPAPDLIFEDVTASINGKYLNTEFTIRNYGLIDSSEFEVEIYADEKLVKTVDSDGIPVGYGRSISLTNLLVAQFKVDKIELKIKNNFSEISKENNNVSLEVRQN